MRNLVVFLWLAVAPLCVLGQKRYYVDNTVQGGQQSGASWTDAHPELQEVLEFLAHSGDEVWIKKGTYYPTSTAERSISFMLKPGVQLYGGFAGNETSIAERDLQANKTVLSGNIGNPNTREDNSYNIITGQDLDSTSCLDGFVLEYAYAETGQGGAVLLTASGPSALCRPAIRNCRFGHNYANKGAGLNCFWDGAGVVSPVLINCTFEFNEARFCGGGLFKNGPAPVESPFIAMHCVFNDNRARFSGYGGGGVCLEETAGSINFRSCSFERDSATAGGVGGGMIVQGVSENTKLYLDSCIFRENFAASGGGMTYAELFGATYGVPFSCYMDGCVFERNLSAGESGGAFEFVGEINSVMQLHMNRCSILGNATWSIATCMFYGAARSDIQLSIRNSQFIGNRDAENVNQRTRAFHYGIRGFNPSPDGRCQATIANCVFARNSAGIKAEGYQAGNRVTSTLTNCTFYRNGLNIVQKDWRPGFNDSSWYNNMTVSNCIFEENTPSWWLFSNNYTTEWRMDGYKIDYVAVKGDVFKLGSIGPHALYNKDPMFADTAVNDFRLRPCSPAVNYGSNPAAEAAGLVTDLDGHPRIFDGTVDLGAYEVQDTCGMVPVTEIPGGLAAPAGLFPNPAEPGAQVTVVLPETEGENAIHWRLEDAMGRLVASGVAGGSVFTTQAPAIVGIYFFVAERGSALQPTPPMPRVICPAAFCPRGPSFFNTYLSTARASFAVLACLCRCMTTLLKT